MHVFFAELSFDGGAVLFRQPVRRHWSLAFLKATMFLTQTDPLLSTVVSSLAGISRTIVSTLVLRSFLHVLRENANTAMLTAIVLVGWTIICVASFTALPTLPQDDVRCTPVASRHISRIQFRPCVSCNQVMKISRIATACPSVSIRHHAISNQLTRRSSFTFFFVSKNRFYRF